ncbi:thermonuclease family protein [Azospirillum sp.]|uniref:thermonuclease family protein n=1 Tax=Azospirillum sp. TaxID=34012 RepID=UPI002D30ECFE|nr:thermonuclease family protein [Azospirillum sp.]HYD70726.1 thermonuclease family protein [Azospirillum sp.]
MRALAAAVLALALPGPAWAQDVIQGTVEAVEDGGTLVVAGTRVRLWGIRALAADQRCPGADGREVRCGRLAALMLEVLTRGQVVECRVRPAAPEDGLTAQCVSAGLDLAATQVLAGNAVDRPLVSGGQYQAEQGLAVARRAGLWANPVPWPFAGDQVGGSSATSAASAARAFQR